MASQAAIRAAGVVLLRQGEHGLEVLLVHRPGRADWSLPKGKLDPGEHVVAAAVRECDEETGFTPVLGPPLPSQSYSVMSQPKVVNYWAATVKGDEGFAPDDEVDEVRWVSTDEAPTLLTYPGDAGLVALGAGLPPTSPLVLLRHTQALKRSQFKGKADEDRPLTGRGRSQSRDLVPLLDAFGIVQVHCSTARRCLETVRRFAKAVDASVEEEPDLSEECHEVKPSAAARRIRQLARIDAPIVVSTHRPVLPTILEALREELSVDPEDPRWVRAWDARLPPGGFIVIHRTRAEDGSMRAVAVERHTASGE
ncbi:MAG: NUDIX hydrolase [Candidatus Nanopelagicales bacterium]